jgi:hypothetical protein
MSWLYFIQEGDSGPIKVGRSTDPWKRLDTLQSGNPRQLRLIAAYRVGKTAHVIERNTHREFIAHRMIGEWYAPVERLVDLAATHGIPSCERCSAKEARLHMWPTDVYGKEPDALCFRCMNTGEVAKIKAKEEEESRNQARWKAEREAKDAAREAGRRN